MQSALLEEEVGEQVEEGVLSDVTPSPSVDGDNPPKKKQKKAACFTCGQVGHLARDCEKTRCHYCGSCGHVAKECTKGLQPGDDFITCGEGCFVRRFILPLSQATTDIDLHDLHAGRVDVGCRSLTATLFRSQGIRHNAEIRLCLQDGQAADKRLAVDRDNNKAGEGVVLAVSGGLARELRPDEASMAERMKRALAGWSRDRDSAGSVHMLTDEERGACEISSQKMSQLQVLDSKLRRGFRCVQGGVKEALLDAVAPGSCSPPLPSAADGAPLAVLAGGDAKTCSDYAGRGEGGVCKGRTVFVKLDPLGRPLSEFLAELASSLKSHPIKEFVSILGDDRGLTPEDERAARDAAAAVGEEVHSVSLGGTMLLASHCIVLMHHYLDTHLHMCPSKLWGNPGKGVMRRRKQTQRRKKAKQGR